MQNICFWARVFGDLPSDEQIEQEIQWKHQIYRRDRLPFLPSETPYDELIVQLANHIQFRDEDEFWDIVDQVLANLDQLSDYIANLDRSKLNVDLQVNRLWFDAPDEVTIPSDIMPMASRLELPIRIGMIMFLPEDPPEDDEDEEDEEENTEPANQAEQAAIAEDATTEQSDEEAIAQDDARDENDEDLADDEEYDEDDDEYWLYFDEDDEYEYEEDEEEEEEEEEEPETSLITLSLRFQGLIPNIEILEQQLPTTFMIGDRAFYTAFEKVDTDVYTMELAHWPYTDGKLLEDPDMLLAVEAINYMMEDLLLLQYSGIDIELLVYTMRYEIGGNIYLPVALCKTLAAADLPITVRMDVSWRNW